MPVTVGLVLLAAAAVTYPFAQVTVARPATMAGELPPEQARDLTQGFFALFLERRDVEAVDPSRGRFRSYLLAAVKNFLANEKARALALKRGAGAVPLSLSFDDDSGLNFEPVDERTPEDDFERQWALAILRRALERLREEQAARGRSEIPQGRGAKVAAALLRFPCACSPGAGHWRLPRPPHPFITMVDDETHALAACGLLGPERPV